MNIEFTDEASETFADTLQHFKGYTVEITTLYAEFGDRVETFDATLIGSDSDAGWYDSVKVQPWTRIRAPWASPRLCAWRVFWSTEGAAGSCRRIPESTERGTMKNLFDRVVGFVRERWEKRRREKEATREDTFVVRRKHKKDETPARRARRLKRKRAHAARRHNWPKP